MVLKGILKSSKTKQRLYDKFFESKTYEHEIIYKNYHKLFQSTEESAKSQYEYFVSVGTKLASEIHQLHRSLEIYFKGSDSSFEDVNLSDEEIKIAFLFP